MFGCIYLQSDAYQATGCYNLLCSGFIQVSSAIAMGASISPVSAYRNSQYDISILIWKVKLQFQGFRPFCLYVKLWGTNSQHLIKWISRIHWTHHYVGKCLTNMIKFNCSGNKKSFLFPFKKIKSLLSKNTQLPNCCLKHTLTHTHKKRTVSICSYLFLLV